MILFTWELGSGLGHLANLRPLVQQLSDAGQQVAVALRNLARARQLFPDPRVRLLQAPCKFGGRDLVDEPLTYAELLLNVGFAEPYELASLTDAWLSLFDYLRPQVIVCDHSPTALLAARATRARRAILGTGFFCPVDQTPLPNLRSWVNADRDVLRQNESRVLASTNSVLSGLGLPALDHVTQLYHEIDETFLLSFAELDHYPAQRPNPRYWGSWVLNGGMAPKWPIGDGPRIFAYLKPFPALGELLSALADTQLPTLIAVDGIDQHWRDKYATPHLHFCNASLNIELASRECEFAVTNGNPGTTTAFLLAGKPTLQIPLQLEQALFTQAVLRLDAGTAAGPTDGSAMRPRLSALLNQASYREGAERFAAKYRDFEPQQAITAIVNRIAELAAVKPDGDAH
jgi:hypothetical protein